MDLSILSLFVSMVALIAAFWSSFASTKSAKHARDSLTTNILIELRKSYSTTEMNKAVHYLMNLRKDKLDEIKINPYTFARNYLLSISPESSEWAMRQKVSHFYNHAATLIQNGLIDEDIFFSIWGEDEFEIIEFLEPIETLIAELYYELPYNSEWSALRLLERGRIWQRKYGKSIDQRFTLPRNYDLYKQSLNSKIEERPNHASAPDAKSRGV